MARREDRLARLAEAKAVLQAQQVEYETKLAQRAERERTTGRKPGLHPSGGNWSRSVGAWACPPADVASNQRGRGKPH